MGTYCYMQRLSWSAMLRSLFSLQNEGKVFDQKHNLLRSLEVFKHRSPLLGFSLSANRSLGWKCHCCSYLRTLPRVATASQ